MALIDDLRDAMAGSEDYSLIETELLNLASQGKATAKLKKNTDFFDENAFQSWLDTEGIPYTVAGINYTLDWTPV